MSLVGIDFSCLTPFAVALEGCWSSLPQRDWRGVAVASEPLLAIAFLQCGGVAEWCKSERRSAEKLDVRLALFPYDAAHLDVQVNFSVGHDGGRRRSILLSHEYMPEIPERREMRTGIIERFTEVASSPRVGLSLLLIARRDVRSARNGLWRVRSELADSIPEPFRRIVTYGRRGRIAGLTNG
jgi:hypothetical protein